MSVHDKLLQTGKVYYRGFKEGISDEEFAVAHSDTLKTLGVSLDPFSDLDLMKEVELLSLMSIPEEVSFKVADLVRLINERCPSYIWCRRELHEKWVRRQKFMICFGLAKLWH